MKKLFLTFVCWCAMVVLVQGQVNGSIETAMTDLRFSQNGVFDLIHLPSAASISDPGMPQLPVIVRSFVLPVHARVTDVRISGLVMTPLAGSFFLFPAQPPVPTDGSNAPAFVGPDSAVYQANLPFPGKRAEVISDLFPMGYHVVTVRFFPLEYFPGDRRVSLCNFQFSIDYVVDDAGERVVPLRQSLHRANLIREQIRTGVCNPGDVDRFAPTTPVVPELREGGRFTPPSLDFSRARAIPAADQVVPEYVIITNNALRPVFERLADWKTKKGIYTVIKTTEEIAPNYPGVDLAEKIRNFLKDAYRFWGAGLYVLLGGDTNIIPARIARNDATYMKPVDRYYATVGGTWDKNQNGIFNESADYPDRSRVFYLGRASVENLTEAMTFVNKVLTYEKTQGIPNLSYFKNNLIASAYPGLDKNHLSGGRMDTLRNISDNIIPPYVHNWLLFDNHHCDNNSGHTYQFTGTCETTCPCGDQELDSVHFRSALQNGSPFGPVHIVYHSDHSSEYTLGASSKDKSQQLSMIEIDRLTNAPYYQIFMTSGCKPATFTEDCIAERHLNNPNGGAVAVIGNSDNGYWGDEIQFKPFCETIYAQPTTQIYGQYALSLAFHESSKVGHNGSTNTRLTLLGDPEMPVWTDQPQRLNVSILPNRLFSGKNTVTFTLPNLPEGEAALICLRNEKEAYVTKSVHGPGPHEVLISVEIPGEIEATVTAHNFIPYETILPFTMSEEKSLSVRRVEIDDSAGNGDGKADAGESVSLKITLRNNSSVPVSNVSARLTNSSDYMYILTTQKESYGTIHPGDSCTKAFSIGILEDAPELWKNDEKASTRFFIHISDNVSFASVDSFGIDILAPELELRNRNITRSGNKTGPIGPNETITFSVDFFNRGSGEAYAMRWSLKDVSPTAISSYTNDVFVLPDIKAREEKMGLGSYQITTALGYTGGPLNMTLAIQNRYGKSWSFPFDLNEAAVSLQGGVKQEADDHSVSLTWYYQPGVKGYNVYRSDAGDAGEDTGVYRKLNAFLVQSGYYKDEGLPAARPYFYKVVPVSGTGNEGTHSGAIFACTSPTIAPNFPLYLEANNKIRGAINVADTDLDGFQEIFFSYSLGDSGNGKIGMLRHDGTDGYNIDGNVTTRADFTTYGAKVHASVGLADLNRDGDYQVISLTRNQGGDDTKNSIFCHSVYDRNNDHLPDLCWRRDTTGNFFKAAAIVDLNPEDAGRSVVVYSDPGVITILDNTGKILRKITTHDGNYTSSSVTVGDLDGDGKIEIVAGAKNGLYIYRNNGTPFAGSNPFFGDSQYVLSSSPILCDLDGDGQKEILISGTQKIADREIYARTFALKRNGSLVPGWNSSQKVRVTDATISHNISVGDLDGDGNPEVVSVGSDSMKIWRNNGTKMMAVKIPEDSFDPFCFTPILADVDGDADIEVIFAKQYGIKIHAYKTNGKSVPGFPITVPCVHSTPCVADVDNDGKNELIAGGNNILYMWKTNGRADRIEWGSDMHDSFNSGDYSFRTPLVVPKNETWSDSRTFNRDLIISAETVTVAGSVLMNGQGVVIRPKTHLILDGGQLNNCRIRILNGGKLTLKNNASIRLNKSYGNLQIDVGGEFNQEYGSVEITE